MQSGTLLEEQSCSFLQATNGNFRQKLVAHCCLSVLNTGDSALGVCPFSNDTWSVITCKALTSKTSKSHSWHPFCAESDFGKIGSTSTMCNLSVCVMQNSSSVSGLAAIHRMFMLYRQLRWIMVPAKMLRLNTVQNILMGTTCLPPQRCIQVEREELSFP